MCSYTDVSEGRVNICDIAVMNELRDVRAYNLMRQRQNGHDEDIVIPPRNR